MQETNSQKAVKLIADLLAIIADGVKESGEQGIPSGHIYAALCGTVPIDLYNNMIDAMIKTGKVKKNNHVLYWIGKK